MDWLDNFGFENILKGEFAGKIYALDKFRPVIDSMRGNPSLEDFLLNVKKYANLLIYFNSQSRNIFAINYKKVNGRLKIEILKPAAQDMGEMHKFSYRLAQIFPASLLTIVDEYHDLAQMESA